MSALCNTALLRPGLGLPDGSVGKSPSANTGDGFRKIPHAAELLRLCATTTEPVLSILEAKSTEAHVP